MAWPQKREPVLVHSERSRDVQTQRTAQAVLCVGTAVHERDGRRPDVSIKERKIGDWQDWQKCFIHEDGSWAHPLNVDKNSLLVTGLLHAVGGGGWGDVGALGGRVPGPTLIPRTRRSTLPSFAEHARPATSPRFVHRPLK